MTLRNSILLLLAIPALTFVWGLGNDFVDWDDPGLITENPISHGLSADNIKAAFTSYDPELYVPLTFVSYQMDYAIGGLSPFIFHFRNLLFHLINVLLVAWMIYLLTGSTAAAVLCGLLFAVHPLNAETVLWASARKDLLSSTWFFAAIIAYLYARERKKTWIWAVSLAAFALGLLSKVMIITLPAILLLIEWREGRLSWKKTTPMILPYVGLSLIFGMIALLGKQAFVAAASLQETALLAGKAVTFLLLKFFVPIRLSVLYPYTDPITFGSFDLTSSLLIVVLLTILALLAARRGHRDFLFGWLWLLLCLSPTFLFYRRGEHLGDIYFTSNRYFYVAGIGLMLPMSLLGASWMKKPAWRTPVIAISTGLIGMFAVMSGLQSLVWQNTQTLFENVLRFYPNSQIAHVTIGNRYQTLGDLENAFAHYDAALKIRPTSLAYFNLGNALLTINKPDEAIEANTRALALDPALAIAEVNLGVGYVKKKMFSEAAEAFRRALALDPNSPEALFNLRAVEERMR